ncbi:MAG: nucleotidyltransferase [Phycisphaerae bacterium]|nr:nucleotidyltransferase [Phycisphaerae bacterium]|tara:strand:- start:56 stop:358 length:303 start_codon:yes stop_codon:yes gene_type:complete
MTRDEIIEAIRDLAPHLRDEYGVASIGIFGSVARGDDGPGSDVDVFVRFASEAKPSLGTFADICIELEKAVGRQVDLVEDHPGLRPRFRQFVEEDLVSVA